MENGKLPFKIISLIGIVLIFILGWIHFYYPAATVVIKPATGVVKKDIRVLGNLDQEKIDWENNVLPLHKFEVTLKDEGQIKASGKKIIGKTKATGNVRFINERDTELKIKAGTVLLSKKNVKYKTLNDIIVPAMEIDYLMDVEVGKKAGQKEVKVIAMEKGTAGNANIGSINKFAEPMAKIHVINPEPIKGGTDIVKTMVSKNDIKKLRQSLAKKMKTRLLNKIYKKLSGNFRLLANEIKYSAIEYNIDQKPGTINEQLTGTAKLEARGYLLKNNELDRLVTNIFKEDLKKGQQLLSSGVIIKNLKLAEKGKGLYNIVMESAGPVIPAIDIDNITEKLTDHDLKDAGRILEKDKTVADYKIKTGKKEDKMPRFNFAIKVIIDEPVAERIIDIE